MSCEKHPHTYNGFNPSAFSEEFKTWSPSYQKSFLNGMIKEYKQESVDDKKRKRVQLSSSLENLATSLYLTNKLIQESDEGKTPIKSAECVAKKFVKTNYFYQREIFLAIRKEMPSSFETVIKSINKVCKSCEKHMENPYKK